VDLATSGGFKMTKLGGWKWASTVFLFYAATLVASPAQIFRTLVNFNGTNGAHPLATLLQGPNGELYGSTSTGGPNWPLSAGTLFKITRGGWLTTVYSFCAQVNCADGAVPQSDLVQGTDGNFYGTTTLGGFNLCYSGCGTVFKIAPNAGTVTTLHRFCEQPQLRCIDGQAPFGVLLQAVNGNFYGTTEDGGSNFSGTVFNMLPGGKLNILYSFCSLAKCADGSHPYAGLIQATDGNFYGTTNRGGANGPYDGTVFRITPAGKLTTIYNFCSLPNCTDGLSPFAGLIQGTDGDLYGTTQGGGTNNNGTVFKITLGGALTTLYNFCSQPNCADGCSPNAGLVQATDGNFYGTTYWCGANYIYGTVFKMTPGGLLTTLHSFCSQSNCPDGANPWAGLVQATDGRLYGTTYGGDFSLGTVFSLDVGLGP
jgi:uncharacterized repeat protein (TIGR03803 family)